MLATNQPDNFVLCALCGTLIEGTHEHLFLGMTVFCRQTLCVACEYQENFRLNRCVKVKPYRDPFPRPTKDGSMPAALREEMAKMHAQRKAEAS